MMAGTKRGTGPQLRKQDNPARPGTNPFQPGTTSRAPRGGASHPANTQKGKRRLNPAKGD